MSQRATAAFGVLDAVSNAVFVLQEDRILWANSAAALLTSYSTEELQGFAFNSLFSVPHANGNSEQSLVSANGTLISVHVALRATEIDGEPVVVATLSPRLSPEHDPVAQTPNENTYRRAIEDGLQGFFLLNSQRDSSGKIVDFIFADVNAHGANMVEHSLETIIGERVSKLFPVSQHGDYLDVFAQAIENHKVLDEDLEYSLPSGEKIWYHRQTVPVEDQVAVFLHSITDRKRIENALWESENRYRALFNQSKDYVTLISLDGRYLLVNPHFAEALGYTVEEIVGTPVTAYMPPQEAEESVERRKQLLAGEDIPHYVRVFKRRDGSEFLGEIDLTMVRDSAGTALCIQSIIRDVTSWVETENAMRESEERYRIISELIFDYAYSMRVEPDGSLVHEWITDSFTRITGYTHTEIDQTGTFALYHPDDAARAPLAIQRVIEGEATSDEYRIITKGGEVRWVHILRHPVWDDAENRVIRMFGVAQDITEQKESEEELRRSEEKYRLIAENATDMITRTSADGLRIYVSSACVTLLGYKPEEMIGQQSNSLIHTDDMESVQNGWNALQISTAPVTFTCRMRHKDGHYVWFEVVSKTIFDPADGSIREYISVARDISQRKQMDRILLEQERLRFELQKEQELNAVKSNLMRTISHEFRTPLTLITLATDFLDLYIERLDEERRKERLDSIREQVKRLSDMLNDISFVVQGTLHRMIARKATFNLQTYCQAILEEIQTTVGKKHQFVYTVEPEAQEGITDKALLRRVLSNLLSNAVKYSPENSVVTLQLSRDSDDIVFQVIDRGIGIAPEEQKHIFEPFYRSRSVIDGIGGTGLGLSIVKDCVDLQGGSISFTSESGKGTTFIVRIPQTPS